jgi:hypothetical protein
MGLNPIFVQFPKIFAVHVFIVPSCSLFLASVVRRDSTSQEFAIQVGTPRRGSTQRINTMYTAKNAARQSRNQNSGTGIHHRGAEYTEKCF